MTRPLVTIAVPSYNQGKYLEDALISIFSQNVPVEVFVMDGGSTDNSLEIIYKWRHVLSGWRSYSDEGQSAAINEGIAQGIAPYVCWLNSDDWFLPGALEKLLCQLNLNSNCPAVYGRAWNVVDKSGKQYPVFVEPFNEQRLALRCIISQPATLIRRSAWEAVGGVDVKMQMSMDYDLWWRLFKSIGPLTYIDDFIAVNREHKDTKTKNQRRLHYKESMSVVKKHYGALPLKWWLLQPYSVWYKSLIGKLYK